MDEIAVGISQDMPLAALDLLACVIATRTTAFSGFHALAVDDTGAGRSLAANDFPRHHQQRVIDRQPQAVVPPKVEPMPDSRYGREARRQHPPRQAAAQQIQDCLDNPPQRPFAGAAYRGRWWQQWLQQPPLGIR